MIQLRFPKRPITPMLRSQPPSTSAGDTLDELLEQIEVMQAACLQNPGLNYDREIRQIIRKSYQITLDMLDEKERQGSRLIPQETDIRILCREELAKPEQPALRGVMSGSFHAISLVRGVIDEIKGWFGLDSASDLASRYLAQAGDALLPGYASLLGGFFTTIDAFFSSDFVPPIIDISAGQVSAATTYQIKEKAVDKALASRMLQFAGFAYKGFDAAGSGGYVSLAMREIPPRLQVLYNETTGLLKASRGLQVWLGKKDNTIVIAYCGTDIKNLDMVYADIEQLSAPSILYLKAAGLMKMLTDLHSGKPVLVTGHSLGGGLTQFALTANLTSDGLPYSGYAYNPAGLSKESMRYLNHNRLSRAKLLVDVFMTAYDPVSTFGAKLGYLVTLPKSKHNLHSMADLKECMALYTAAAVRAVAVHAFPMCTICGVDYTQEDILPYSSKVTLCTVDKTTYWPCFYDAYRTGTVRNVFLTANASKEMMNLLGKPNQSTDCCAGVYEGFNGTGHTAANRLLLSCGSKASTAAANGDIYSVIVFGAYGLGEKQFIHDLQRAYVESGAIFSLPRSHYEEMLARVRNPYEEEKAAWIAVLRSVMDIDSILRDYPQALPILEHSFLTFSSEREDLFQSLYHDRKPTRTEKQSMLKGLKALAERHTRGLLTQAVQEQMLTGQEKEFVLSQLNTFCDAVIQALSREA